MAPTLQAIYNSPNNPPSAPRSFQLSLKSPLPSTVSDSTKTSKDTLAAKTAYLAELRQLVPQLQNEINVFLTERMEEDKRVAEAAGVVTFKDDKQAKREEENYGEENVEDEET